MRRALATLALGLVLGTVPTTVRSEDIVVTAVPQDREALRRIGRGFAGALLEVSDADQVARRTQPYCLGIFGLDPAYRPLLADHIAQAAAVAGVSRNSDPGCRSNLSVIFNSDGDSLVAALRDKVPTMFVNLDAAKKEDLLHSHRPVRWWYTVETQGRDGERLIDGQLNTTNSSLVSSGIRANLSGVVIIVDVTRAEGYTLNALASYVAMVAFAQIRMPRGDIERHPSILAMFARSGSRQDGPQQLTVWDRAYLKGIYAIRMDRPAWQQRPAIVSAMIRALEADAAGERARP